MRISDWSSDVCSSDLLAQPPQLRCLALALGDDAIGHPAALGAMLERGQHRHLVRFALHRELGDHVVRMYVGERRLPAVRQHVVQRAVGEELEGLQPQACAQLREYLHRSEEHTYELPSLMRISYAVFCLKKKKANRQI